MKPLVVDAHEDIAWNVLTFGRDYTRTVAETRQMEAGTPIPGRNGHTLLGKDAWLDGNVAIVFATLFLSPIAHKHGKWDTQCYRSPDEAYRQAGRQLDTYHRLAEETDLFREIGTQGDLADVLAGWQIEEEDNASEDDRRIGLLPLMEGADPIVEPEQVEEWFERGVRIVGPAWRGTRYAGGTGDPGPLTGLGFRLLEVMQSLGMVLDLSHMAEEAYLQAVSRYEATLIATHSNPRFFFPDDIKDRGLTDEMIALLAERDGVIGIVPYNKFLNPLFQLGDPKTNVSLLTAVDAIDHICQVTGSAAHVGIGSDFDGGFGWEKTPAEIDTIADLQKFVPLLGERGLSAEQIADVMGGNWLRILRQSLPN